MPIKQKNGKWYWGSQGPFESKKKAEEVARAAHSAGFAKTEIGAIMEGEKPHMIERPLVNHPSYPPRDKTRRKRLDWTEDTPTAKLLKDKSYLHPEQRDYRKAPNEKSKGSPPYVNDDPQEVKHKPQHPTSHSHHHLHKEGDKQLSKKHRAQRKFIEPHSTLQKEGDGGEGGGTSFGGTVFTSTNAGIFSPTYGEREAKSKKKRSGIEKLGVFLTDGSPTKKAVKKSAGMELVEWLLKQDEGDPQKPIERTGDLPPENAVLAEQKDMEDKIKILSDQDKKRRSSMEENANPPTGGEGSLPDNGVGQSRAFALSKEPMAWGPYDNTDDLKRTGSLDTDDDDYYDEEFEKAMGHLYQISKEDDQPNHPVADVILQLMKDKALDGE